MSDNDDKTEHPTGETDPEVLAIRAMIEDQETDLPHETSAPASSVPSSPASADALPATAPPDTSSPMPRMMPRAMTRPKVAQKRAERRAKLAAKLVHVLRLIGVFLWQVARHPHTPRVVAGAMTLLAFLLWPVAMVLLGILTILVAAVVYFSVGPEAVDAFLMRRFEALKARDPARAARLRGRVLWGISMLNKGIDRLPERWTAGLYLPDLEDPVAPPDKMHDDPFERLEPVPGGQTVIRKAAPAAPTLPSDLPPDLPPDPRLRTARPTSGPRRPPRQIRPAGHR